MKYFLLVMLLIPSLSFAEIHLDYEATTALSHHEEFIGDNIARYRLSLIPSYEHKRFDVSLRADAYGTNDWQAGHFKTLTYWQDADWTVEDWRFSLTTKGTFWLYEDKVGLYGEYYFPIDRQSWGQNNASDNKFWMIGFRGRLF